MIDEANGFLQFFVYEDTPLIASLLHDWKREVTLWRFSRCVAVDCRHCIILYSNTYPLSFGALSVYNFQKPLNACMRHGAASGHDTASSLNDFPPLLCQ